MSGRRLSIFADESAKSGSYRHFLGGVALLTSDVGDIEGSLRESASNYGWAGKEMHWSQLKRHDADKALGFCFEFLKLVGPCFRLRLYCNKHMPERGRAEAKFKKDGIARVYGTFLRRSFGVVNSAGDGEYTGVDFNLDRLEWPERQMEIFREHLCGMALDCHRRSGAPRFGIPDYKLEMTDSKDSRILQGVDLVLGAWQHLLVHKPSKPDTFKAEIAMRVASLIRSHPWGVGFARDKGIFPPSYDSPFGVWYSKYKTQQ